MQSLNLGIALVKSRSRESPWWTRLLDARRRVESMSSIIWLTRASKQSKNSSLPKFSSSQSLRYRRHLPSCVALQQSMAALISASRKRFRLGIGMLPVSSHPPSNDRTISVLKSHFFLPLDAVNVEFPSRGDFRPRSIPRCTFGVCFLRERLPPRQSLVRVTNARKGLTSHPTVSAPLPAAARSDVPLPQNGSSTTSFTSHRADSIACSTRLGEKASFTKYQRWRGMLGRSVAVDSFKP